MYVCLCIFVRVPWIMLVYVCLWLWFCLCVYFCANIRTYIYMSVYSCIVLVCVVSLKKCSPDTFPALNKTKAAMEWSCSCRGAAGLGMGLCRSVVRWVEVHECETRVAVALPWNKIHFIIFARKRIFFKNYTFWVLLHQRYDFSLVIIIDYIC